MSSSNPEYQQKSWNMTDVGRGVVTFVRCDGEIHNDFGLMMSDFFKIPCTRNH